MGNSFHFDVLYFYGAHAVENLFCRWRASRFTLAALKQLKPFTVLCQTFGISRRCGYKWLERFRRDGRSGLHNRSRRPRRSPRRTPVRWRQAVRRLRQRFPHWGAKKIYPRLRRQFPHAACPPCAPSPSGCHGFVRCAAASAIPGADRV